MRHTSKSIADGAAHVQEVPNAAVVEAERPARIMPTCLDAPSDRRSQPKSGT
jgi:hypothetical protein